MSTSEVNIVTLSNDIQQKIIDKCDHYTIEEHIQQLCVLYVNKWEGFTDSDKIDEFLIPDFVSDSRLVFSIFHKHYGCEEALKEINECLLKEPDAQSDVNEYLQFVENLNISQNITESDYKDGNSKLDIALTNSI